MKHTHSRPLLPKVASMTTLPIAPSSQQALGTNKRSQHDFSQARADKNSAAFPLDSQPLKSRTMSCIKESRLNELKSRYPKLFSEMFPKNSSPHSDDQNHAIVVDDSDDDSSFQIHRKMLRRRHVRKEQKEKAQKRKEKENRKKTTPIQPENLNSVVPLLDIPIVLPVSIPTQVPCCCTYSNKSGSNDRECSTVGVDRFLDTTAVKVSESSSFVKKDNADRVLALPFSPLRPRKRHRTLYY